MLCKENILGATARENQCATANSQCSQKKKEKKKKDRERERKRVTEMLRSSLSEANPPMEFSIVSQ